MTVGPPFRVAAGRHATGRLVQKNVEGRAHPRDRLAVDPDRLPSLARLTGTVSEDRDAVVDRDPAGPDQILRGPA